MENKLQQQQQDIYLHKLLCFVNMCNEFYNNKDQARLKCFLNMKSEAFKNAVWQLIAQVFILNNQQTKFQEFPKISFLFHHKIFVQSLKNRIGKFTNRHRFSITQLN